MSQVIWDDMTESPGVVTPISTQGGPLPYEQPAKLKGPQTTVAKPTKDVILPFASKNGPCPPHLHIPVEAKDPCLVSLWLPPPPTSTVTRTATPTPPPNHQQDFLPHQLQ